jgi:hypothetical protein
MPHLRELLSFLRSFWFGNNFNFLKLIGQREELRAERSESPAERIGLDRVVLLFRERCYQLVARGPSLVDPDEFGSLLARNPFDT